MNDRRRWITTPSGYLMVLEQGDDVFAHLTALVSEDRFGAASFTGFGFVRTVTFGFFDFDKREYDPATFEQCELAGMTGTLAWKEGKPSIHAHGVACDSRFACHGGHLLALEVGTGSVEIAIAVVRSGDAPLQRTVEPSIGANILRLGACPAV